MKTATIVKVQVGVPYLYNNSDTDESRTHELNQLREMLIRDGMLDPEIPVATNYYDHWDIMCPVEYAWALQHTFKYQVEQAEYQAFVPQFIKDVFIESSVAPAPRSVIDEHEYFNERVEVHMPGHSLAMFNAVMLLTDACTDALQGNLNQGWRILAVCPQPDQRRPDYILGRYEEPANLGHKGAARG